MKILIVDDEIRAVQALVRRIPWQEYGFETTLTAYSMAQAQEIFSRSSVQLMLCDIEMPQGNGLELFEWVKSYYPKTECIFVTCHDEYEYLRAAMQLGSCDYILKPINYDQLKDTLAAASKRLEARESRKAPSISFPVPYGYSNPYITKIMAYIAEHLAQDISISDLAEEVHLNEQYVMRLFKKETGSSILQYITSQRIALSINYLQTSNLPITEIALNCGFDNYSYFTRIFKRISGETPAAFRKASKA